MYIYYIYTMCGFMLKLSRPTDTQSNLTSCIMSAYLDEQMETAKIEILKAKHLAKSHAQTLCERQDYGKKLDFP